jgi:hypothetical protein
LQPAPSREEKYAFTNPTAQFNTPDQEFLTFWLDDLSPVSIACRYFLRRPVCSHDACHAFDSGGANPNGGLHGWHTQTACVQRRDRAKRWRWSVHV